ncbi:type II toxin-antitoxin system HicA family toxin [Roseburia sp. AM51-8]|uniref:type II toxin-antitoxin system HicA family toxin n=1 Tax=Roseburia sp. AM51-8 TaxID=2292366 RepID=UPI000E51126D|nr:type II toxin-antitoxin system HicA family toxin [Roseburia sp. AM51-8]RHP98992.1 type II toxin-antitoxin system HicA family toxin [Roseburia sp. AM51-8]
MKRADLIRTLEQNGWYLLRNGSNHDIYTNGVKKEPIPRHKEISERLAKTILKRAGV